MSDRSDSPAPPPSSETSAVWTVGALIDALELMLGVSGVEAPRAEARDIVAIGLDRPRLWPGTHLDAPVPAGRRDWMVRAAARRGAGAPFAYAVGRSAFRSLTLRVDERVLIPRQETEELVELVLRETRAGNDRGIAVDVGTGSGAIALSLAAEGDWRRVIATDVSADALAVANANREALPAATAARVELRLGSALAPVRGIGASLLVSNPPYVTHAEARTLAPGVRDWEPPVALYGGADGLDLYRRLARGAPDTVAPGGLVALEVDARRASLVAEMFAVDARYASVSVRRDLSGRERYVLARVQGSGFRVR